ncbi:hypothetical protein [Clostridium baratii]|uniref:hypothetical protein n=1 Tax=Clostridium baratii TaxID=1561 RepID=UPI0030D1B85E
MFSLGQVIITRRIKNAMEETFLDNNELLKCLILHSRNISESCEEDRQYNLEDIKNKCGRVLNKYTIYGEYKIFINTYLGVENETTIMFCDEY